MNGSSQAAVCAPTGSVSAKSNKYPPLVDANGNPLSVSNRHLLGGEKDISVDGFNRPPANLNEAIDRTIAREEDYLYKLKMTKEKLKELKFKQGDVARHAKYGNVLISNVVCRALHEGNSNILFPEDSFFMYEITYMSVEDHNSIYNAGRPVHAAVRAEELIPITELAETLFR